MENKSKFIEILSKLTAKEIIMAMVKGLQEKRVDEVNMDTYLYVHEESKKCFGCAATNTIAVLLNVHAKFKDMPERKAYSPYQNTTGYWLYILYGPGAGGKAPYHISDGAWVLESFEGAIDQLRRGRVYEYNHLAEQEGFARIKKPRHINLPCLESHNYADNLQPYIDLANSQ